MRKIVEVLRLKWDCKKSHRQIAESCAISISTVSDYVNRAKAAGLSWPLPTDLDEEKLNALLFRKKGKDSSVQRPVPKWEAIHVELKKKGVTLLQLWIEFKAEHPEGYQYSQFCSLYRKWKKSVDPCMRQDYQAGEKLFVDYCGQTVPVVDRASGEVREAQIFVSVLGASNYTYAEATLTQQLPDWIGSHVRALEWYGGCPELIIPDNLRSGVSRSCRYEPDVNPSYQEFAKHYGITVIPARVRKPRDKAKCEKGVQTVENWILAPLRHRTFFSLQELNEAIRNRLQELNERPFQKMDGCRRTLFESLERPALQALPVEPYEYAEWKKARVSIDYHIDVERHYYSVPYKFIHRQVEVRLTANTIEVFSHGVRIASHVRSTRKGSHTTVTAHMPKSHQEYLDWPPERLQRKAEQIGVSTAQVITCLLERRLHPAQGYRSCLGVLRLAKEYGNERLERACERALLIQAISYKSIRSILQKGIDRLPPPEPPTDPPSHHHENIRGSKYYH